MNVAFKSFSMTDKTVMVIGAGTRLGAHIVKVLSRAGARVGMGAPDVEQLKQLSADLHWEGGKVVAVEVDVSQRQSVEAALDVVQARFGGIDVLINTVSKDYSPTLFGSPLDALSRVTQCISRRMVEAGRAGSIINITAADLVFSGSRPDNARADIIQLSQSLAELQRCHGIRVNTIAPQRSGVPRQEQQPLRLDDINGPLLLLASDAGACLTGAVLPIADTSIPPAQSERMACVTLRSSQCNNA